MENRQPRRKATRLAKTVYQQGHAYFVTACTLERKPWFAETPGLAAECADLLLTLAVERASTLFAWCLMPDHLHLLLQDKDLVAFMRLFKGRMTDRARAMKPGASLWQRGFFDHTLRGDESLPRVAEYIWTNPVRAGLVAHPGEYAWSGSLVWPDWREHPGMGKDGRG